MESGWIPLEEPRASASTSGESRPPPPPQLKQHNQRCMGKCCVLYSYYSSNAFREVKKRKFNYCLGTCSCFIVVLVAAICYTLISKSPVVFLQQAEGKQGQCDMRAGPSADSDFVFMNYTRVTELLAPYPNLGWNSPRLAITSGLFGSDCTDFIKAVGLDPYGRNWEYFGVKGNPLLMCGNTSSSCVPCEMAPVNPYLRLIDTNREKAMGFGRNWPFAPLQEGQVVMSSDVAQALNVKEGDVFFATFYSGARAPWFTSMIEQAMQQSTPWLDENSTKFILQVAMDFGSEFVFPATVAAVIDDSYGKFGTSEQNILLMEYGPFFQYIMKYSHPNLDVTDAEALRTTLTYPTVARVPPQLQAGLPMSVRQYAGTASLWQYASEICYNLPPKRTEVYMNSNYQVIQDAVVSFSAQVAYITGFSGVKYQLLVLKELETYKFFSLYLGLILSVILAILFILSTMLIYSLLLISVETRTFELGVHRMVGMSRRAMVELLLTQACSYSLPAWSVGLIVAQIGASIILSSLEDTVQVPIDKLLTPTACGWATFLGLFIPLVSALLPIRAALSRNLHDSLDTAHSKTLGVEFSIERSGDGKISTPWLVTGILLAVVGFFIYYLLPLSLLSFDLTLFFNVFFCLLMGMLFGMILLASNIGPLVERFLVFLFFFWEKRSVSTLVTKNLIAHRVRNRKTSLMYAVALGFIIFIRVGYQMELVSAESLVLKSYGQRFVATGTFTSIAVAAVESRLAKMPDVVADWAWVSQPLASDYYSVETQTQSTALMNLGRAYTKNLDLYAVSPNFFDIALPQFLISSSQSSTNGLSLSQQLYTAEGSQGVLLPSILARDFALPDLSSKSSFLIVTQGKALGGQPGEVHMEELKPIAFLDGAPYFSFSNLPVRALGSLDAVVSFPTYVRLSNGKIDGLDGISMEAILLQLQPNAPSAKVDQLRRQLLYGPDADTFDFRSVQSTLDKTNSVMDMIFTAATYVAMGLCLFSLMASMYTNIFEQSKEIAVLRALGFTKPMLIRAYLYEAFVLTLAASLLGVVIGGILGWTLTMQQMLFTELPITFVFPYIYFLVVGVGAILCAIASSLLPARALLNRPIASIARIVL